MSYLSIYEEELCSLFSCLVVSVFIVCSVFVGVTNEDLR